MKRPETTQRRKLVQMREDELDKNMWTYVEVEGVAFWICEKYPLDAWDGSCCIISWEQEYDQGIFRSERVKCNRALLMKASRAVEYIGFDWLDFNRYGIFKEFNLDDKDGNDYKPMFVFKVGSKGTTYFASMIPKDEVTT